MELNKTANYSYYKNLNFKRNSRFIINRKKVLIIFSTILVTSFLKPINSYASTYQELTPIEEEKVEKIMAELKKDREETENSSLTSAEQEKLDKIMQELKRIKDETQARVDEYYNSQEVTNELSNDLLGQEKVALSEEQRYYIFNEYCGYYGLDSIVVYKLGRTLTNEFSDANYINNYVIGNTTFYGKSRVYPNEEAGIIAFIRCLSLNPEDYNISSNDITNGVYNKFSGSYEQMTSKISDLLGVDKTTMLAIMYHETGYFSSDSFVYRNNPAGIMKGDSGVKSFDSKEAGIIESIYNFYFRFCENNKKISLEEIGNVYCPVGASNDDGTNINWLSGVSQIKQELESNLEIFEKNDKNKGI